MRKFKHINARSVEDAAAALRQYGNMAWIMAGGTDLLGKMKDEILPIYPEALVNVKTIPGLDSISGQDGILRIGALATLEDIAQNPLVQSRCAALAQAARRAASPHLRAMGTLGGNVCQDIRCWYYRNPRNRFPCLRKGGGRCYAIEGDNRYHSIFGGSVEGGCYAVHPGDAAPALVALSASVVTSKRTIGIEDFFAVGVEKTTVLDSDEIVLGIDVPEPTGDCRSSFLKFAVRKSIDFPIVNCAAGIAVSAGKIISARICLNAVFLKPYRVFEAEKILIGGRIEEESAEAAAEAAVSAAQPLEHNRYMVSIAGALVKRSILACRKEANTP
jgi:xanthine dehydrogenase YagS FAD-binding subunit